MTRRTPRCHRTGRDASTRKRLASRRQQCGLTRRDARDCATCTGGGSTRPAPHSRPDSSASTTTPCRRPPACTTASCSPSAAARWPRGRRSAPRSSASGPRPASTSAWQRPRPGCRTTPSCAPGRSPALRTCRRTRFAGPEPGPAGRDRPGHTRRRPRRHPAALSGSAHGAQQRRQRASEPRQPAQPVLRALRHEPAAHRGAAGRAVPERHRVPGQGPGPAGPPGQGRLRARPRRPGALSGGR